MNFSISKITIKNVKGKEYWSYKFDGLCPNKVNLFVATNGFGKSTITTAFKAVSNGTMKLGKNDYYKGNENNNPSMEIEYTNDDISYKVTSDKQKGEISRAFYIHVINNPVYAKPTGKNMGGIASHSAELFIRDIPISAIPDKCKLAYSVRKMRSLLGSSSPNMEAFFTDEKGLEFIIANKHDINKCCNQMKASKIVSEITSDSYNIVVLKQCDVLSKLLDKIANTFNLDEGLAVKYLVQILYVVEDQGIEKVQKAYKWIEYDNRMQLLNKRIDYFNTTGLNLRCSKCRDKTSLSFGRADRMSNGERDVLSFVASLLVFESKLSDKPSILIIDEVFDYLDGANLLAVQYYLSKIIESARRSGNVVFPIVMTHLDPQVFKSYCLKRMAIHYLDHRSSIDLNDNVVQLLFLRTTLRQNNDNNTEMLEKNMLHYNPNNWTIPKNFLSQLPTDFWTDSQSFKEYINKEMEKYLNEENYNALAVVIALRNKICQLKK